MCQWLVCRLFPPHILVFYGRWIKALCFYLIKVEVCVFIKEAEKSTHGVWFVVNGLPLQSPAFVTAPCRLCTQWLHGSVLKRTARVYSYQMYNYYHIWICVHTLPHMPLRHTSCLFFPPCLSPSWSINTLSSAEVRLWEALTPASLRPAEQWFMEAQVGANLALERWQYKWWWVSGTVDGGEKLSICGSTSLSFSLSLLSVLLSSVW